MKNDVKKVAYGIPLPLMDKSYFPCRSPGSSQIVSYVENVALDGSNSNDLDVDSLNYYWHRIGGLYHICYEVAQKESKPKTFDYRYTCSS